MTRFITYILPALALTACAPTTHEIGYASENTIEVKYSAYALTPTLTADLAACLASQAAFFS